LKVVFKIAMQSFENFGGGKSPPGWAPVAGVRINLLSALVWMLTTISGIRNGVWSVTGCSSTYRCCFGHLLTKTT